MMMDPQTVLQVLENQETQAQEQWEPMYSVGEEVVVQSRTWPGINKPGGPARITAVLEGGKYNVKYLLGGSEKNVEERWICSRGEDTEKRKRKAVELFEPELVPTHSARAERRTSANPRWQRKHHRAESGDEENYDEEEENDDENYEEMPALPRSPVKSAKPKSSKKPLRERQAHVSEPSSPELHKVAAIQPAACSVIELINERQRAREAQASVAAAPAVDPRLEAIKERVQLELEGKDLLAMAELQAKLSDVSEEDLKRVVKLLEDAERVYLDEETSTLYTLTAF